MKTTKTAKTKTYIPLLAILAAVVVISGCTATGEVTVNYLGEGESGPVSDEYACSEGLSAITCDAPGEDGECGSSACTDTFFCTYCGDNTCQEPENECNCARDCGTEAPGNIFVTSAKFTGDLGGILGADAKCQEAASNAGYTGTWVALVSNTIERGGIFGGERLPKAVEFVNMNGEMVARNHIDISDGAIENRIVNEFGEACTSNCLVWTGSYGYPYIFDTDFNCNQWTKSTEEYRGTTGNSFYTNFNWMEWNLIQSCEVESSLYCIQI
jgi:hypothetical protein